MKKIILSLALLVSCNSFAQTAPELVAEATEMAMANPNNTDIKTTLEKALDLQPTNEAALYQLAIYHINHTTDHYAMSPLTKLIDIAPTNPEYYWLRAKINIRKNALKAELLQAQKDLQRAKELGYADTDRLTKASGYIEQFLN